VEGGGRAEAVSGLEASASTEVTCRAITYGRGKVYFPSILRGGHTDSGAAPEVGDLAPDHHQQPVGGCQKAIT
jgi:hypothetical protein